MNTPNHPPRVWIRLSCVHGGTDGFIGEPNEIITFFPRANTDEHLSLVEHQSLLSEAQSRIRELEHRLQYLLDDSECELYRKQAIEALAAKGTK